jgi:hypothetical protein
MFIGFRTDLTLLILVILLAAGCHSTGERTPARPDVQTVSSQDSTTSSTATQSVRQKNVPSSTDMLQAQFQATIYEVQADPAQVNEVDGRVLTKQADSAEKLLAALSRIGEARILYRFDQPVNVFSETLRLGTQEPVVTNSRTAPNGAAINTIQYHEVGAIIQLSANRAPAEAKRKGPNVKLSVEMAVLSNSEAEIVPGRKVSSIRSVSLSHSESLEFGQPRVMLAVSSTSSDPKQYPALYVVRYLFKR